MRHIIIAAVLAAALLGTFTTGYRLGHAQRPAAGNVPVAEPPPAVQPRLGKLELKPADVVELAPPMEAPLVEAPPEIDRQSPPPPSIRTVYGSHGAVCWTDR